MDHQDQRAIHTSGGHDSHGVYVCYKCGWPFPNPHPSARHRRAHKRICGTIEGYKLVDSEENTHFSASDEEHLSDDDHKTPSPKVIERSNNETGSGGIGERSGRSEDEVFSDAVTEFHDSGFSPGSATESSTKEERIAKDDLSSSQTVNDSATDIIQPPSISSDSSQVQNPDKPKSKTNQLGSTTQSQDHVPGSIVGSVASSISDFKAEESAGILSNDRKSSACDSYPIKPEPPTDASQENDKSNAGENVTEVIWQESNEKGIEEINSDRNSLDIVVSPGENAISEAVSKLQETDEKTSELIPAGGVVQSKEEQIDGLGPKMFTSDVSPEVESVGHIGTSAGIGQIEGDAAQVIDFSSSGNSIEGCNGEGEGNENVHVLSVPDDIPVLDHPEIMVEGFKDHKGVKLHQPVTLDSCETVKDKEDDVKDPVSEENYSSYQSRPLSEGAEASSLETHVLEDDLKQEAGDSKPMVKEVPVEGEASAPHIKVTINENDGSDGQGTPADAATVEMEKSHTDFSPEEQEPHDICNNSFQMNIPENVTKVLSDVNPVVAPMDAEVNHAASLGGIVDARSHENAGTESCDITGNDNSRGAAKQNYTENIITTPESASNIFDFQVHPMTNLLEGDDAGHHEHDKIQKCDTAGVKSREGPIGENDSVETKTTPETASSLHESQVVAEDVMDGSGRKLQEIECTHMDGVSDLSRVGIHGVSDTHEGTKEQENNGNYKVQSECVGGGSVAAALYHSGDDKLLHSTSEDHMIKEPLQSSLDTGSSIQSSAAVEENDAREFDGDASGISSKSFQPEEHSNVAKQQLGASAIDVSVDSMSQTDSLEGNWGSVSVLSIQSDAPAFIDSETFPSTGSQASAEKTKLKEPNPSFEGQRSDKSDIFDAPSFMTLVEPQGGVDQNADASEIQTVPNPQQSKAAPVQAGWFPSITHVVNESHGRKKNEEIIAKVTNWSTGKQHTPLKSLLGEANGETKPKFPNSKENQTPMILKDETMAKDNRAVPTTVNSILGPESPAAQPAKIQSGREWDSPARYPSEIKREKRKVKGRPYWAQFVCCSSVN